MVNTIDISKSLPRERWGEFFDQFSESNRGQHISIEIIDSEIGDKELIQNAPLLAMIYDLPFQGDNLAIKVGIDEMTYGYTVGSPTSVTTGQNSNGEITAIQIADSARRKILVKLQAS